MRIRLLKSIGASVVIVSVFVVRELAFTEGRGPNPATKDTATDFVGVEADPLQ